MLNSAITLSSRVQKIEPSATMVVAAKARALRESGVNVVDLGLGEPDFDTPENIKNAAIAAIHQGFTKYTPVGGFADLKKAIQAKLQKENNLHYEPSQIVVSCGGKQSLYNLFQAVVNSGDEVIYPAPYWVSYPDMVLLADGKPVPVFAGIEQSFKITAEQLEKAITPKTKIFLINCPSNPTGMSYTRAELKALGNVLAKHPHVLVATDDMYEHILWAKEPFSNILNACPNLYDRTIILNGVSKAYAMTGWRIGFAAGPTPLIEAMTTIQSQCTSGASSISQKAAKEAFTGDQSSVGTMVKSFKERHDYLVKALNTIVGVQCLPADGTFFVFPKVQGLVERLGLKDDMVLTEFLLNKAGVAVIPGSPFGGPGYIRLSFATSLENLQNAVERMVKVLE